MISTAKTTYNGKRPFAFSYSKLKNYESCPKKFYHLEVAKDIQEEESEALQYGGLVHKLLAQRVADGTEIPPFHRHVLEPWAKKILGPYADAKAFAQAGEGRIMVEQKLAITDEFAPCEYFDKNVWFRSVGDVIKVTGPVALVADYKTGKILEDSSQLAMMAACVFAHFPEIEKIRAVFIWLKSDARTDDTFERKDMPGMWAGLWSRIEALRKAYETNLFPPKPGGLCARWCPVSVCKHHGGR